MPRQADDVSDSFSLVEASDRREVEAAGGIQCTRHEKNDNVRGRHEEPMSGASGM
jgi:hypothetical protein